MCMVRLNDADPVLSQAGLREILEASGCEAQTITRCLELWNAGRVPDQLRVLERERSRMMDDLHLAQHNIDRLDYVIRILQHN